jgi:hypothetical protein
MSGEGADRYFAGTDDAQGDQCRRSPTAYPVIAATEGTLFNRLIFLACSGARTSNVIATSDDPHARAQTGEPGTQSSQLVSLLGRHATLRPKLVILTLGGNDAGFGTIGRLAWHLGTAARRRLFINNSQGCARRSWPPTHRCAGRSRPPHPRCAVPQPLAKPTCDGVALTGSERTFIRDFPSTSSTAPSRRRPGKAACGSRPTWRTPSPRHDCSCARSPNRR